MKVNKIIKSTVEEELEITGATLLSIEEAEESLTEEERKHTCYYWLRSPGFNSSYAAHAYFDGEIDSYGYSVNNALAVRPALQITNLESSNLEIGDTFELGDFEFKVISDNLAWMHKQDIGGYVFNNYFNNGNDYETSDVKKFVDKWFELLIFNESEER